MDEKVVLMAQEYASYFLGGLEGITREMQDRLNEIEDDVRERGIDWDEWSALCMDELRKLES